MFRKKNESQKTNQAVNQLLAAPHLLSFASLSLGSWDASERKNTKRIPASRTHTVACQMTCPDNTSDQEQD